MTQVTLFAPDITCDHCIATIKRTAGETPGVTFLEGDVDSRSFAVDVERGEALDALGAALANEGYPLGEARPARATSAATTATAPAMVNATNVAFDLRAPGPKAFAPAYTVEKSAEGASITYTCPCGSTTERYTYDRSQAEQAVGSCCDHHLLMGPDAAKRLRDRVGAGYAIDVQTVLMPWGQPVEAAFASKS